MSTKTITGTITTGYTLGAAYSGANITYAGEVDSADASKGGENAGVALTLPRLASVGNNGQIQGGAGGGAGYHYPSGGSGGIGALFSAGGSLANRGVISGGGGGSGVYGIGGGGVGGGAGGAGVSFTAKGTVVNAGTISGGGGGYGDGAGGYGVVLAAGGSVTNSATISGGAGGGAGEVKDGATYIIGGPGENGSAGVILMAAGNVENSGLIVGGAGGAGSYTYDGEEKAHYVGGTGGAGIVLQASGEVSNTGRIEGGAGGSGGEGATGAPGDGVVLTAGGTVVNGSPTARSAWIGGGVGVYAGAAGAATVTNYGTIEGTGGVAVQFKSASDTLIAEAGSTFVGVAQGGGGTLELAGGTGTLSGLGSGTLTGADGATFIGFGSYVLGDKATFTVAGSITVAGTLGIASTTDSTTLVIGPTGATFANGDVVSLSGDVARIVGSTAPTTLTNDGLIEGQGFLGVGRLTLVNETDGVIDATGAGGIDLNTGAATLANAGLLEASDKGKLVLAPTTISQAAGTIEAAGQFSVVDFDDVTLLGGTVVNAGTIVGNVSFGAPGRLVVDPGAHFSDGDAAGDGGVLEFAQNGGTISFGAGGGTVSGPVGLAFSDFGTYQLDAGAWSVSGTNALAAGETLANSGVLDASGSFAAGSAVVNSGQLDLAPGGGATLLVGADGTTLSGGGTVGLSQTASNQIEAAAPATLTNVNDRIGGAGTIGGNANLTLVNEAAGVIDSLSPSAALVIDTGANTIVNAGVLEGGSTGGLAIESPIDNTGSLIAHGGTLTAEAAVTGSGSAIANAGTLVFASMFSQNVTFGATGRLVLADSRAFGGTLADFSRSGGASLDLEDIAFATAKATYSGTSSSGVLTVTDGTHTAKIHFTGNYTAASWTLGKDASGGTLIVDPAKVAASHAVAVAPTHPFIAAAASFGASRGDGLSMPAGAWRPSPAALATPRA